MSKYPIVKEFARNQRLTLPFFGGQGTFFKTAITKLFLETLTSQGVKKLALRSRRSCRQYWEMGGLGSVARSAHISHHRDLAISLATSTPTWEAFLCERTLNRPFGPFQLPPQCGWGRAILWWKLRHYYQYFDLVLFFKVPCNRVWVHHFSTRKNHNIAMWHIW